MKNNLTPICFLLFSFCFLNAHAQTFDWKKANQDFLKTYEETTYDEGLTKAKALLTKTIAVYGEKHTHYASALYNLAALHTEVSNVKEGLPLAEKVLTFYEKSNMPLEQGLTHVLLARLHAGISQVGGAQTKKHLIQAFTLFRQVPEARNSLEFGAALYRGALLAMNGNDFIDSEKYLEQAMELLEQTNQKDSPMYATCLEAKAILYGMYMGRYGQLETIYKESFDIREKQLGTSHPDFQAALEFAIPYFEEADPEKAVYYTNLKDDELLYGQRYLHYKPSVLRPGLLTEKFIPYTLSYSQEGAAGAAMGLPTMADGDIDISSFMNMEDMEKSAEAMNEMIAQMTRNAYGKKDPKTGRIDPESLMDTAGFQAKMMNSLEMQKMIQMSQEISTNAYAKVAEKSDYTSPVMKINARLMQVKTSGQPITWELKEEELSAYGEEFGTHHFYYRNRAIILADDYTGNGQYQNAREHYNRVIDSYLNQFDQFDYMSEDERSAFWDQVRQSLFDYNEFVVKAANELPLLSADAYNYQLKVKSKIFNTTSRIKRLVSESPDEKVKTRFRQWTDLRNKLANVGLLSLKERNERGIDIDDIYEQANMLEKEIAESILDSDQRNTQTELKPDWKDIQQALPKNAAAIEIIRYATSEDSGENIIGNYEDVKPEHYAALIITAGAQNPQIVPLGAANTLDKKAYQLYLEYVSNTRYQREASSGYQTLTAQYWQPIARALPPTVDELYLSPSGTYNLINLEILPMTEPGEHVMDHHTVHRVSGTAGIITAASKTLSADNSSIALFGDPTFTLSDEEWAQQANTTTERAIGSDNNRSTSTWLKRARIKSLPWTRAEVESLETLFKAENWQISKFLGNNASEKQLKQLTSPRILHVATHGYFDRTISGVHQEQMSSFGELVEKSGERQNAMLGAGLLFSGVKNYFSSNRLMGEDGALTAYEISGLYLNQTELVVLSACNTGQGLVDEGEGVYGLQRAFKLAGAGSMLMSLWSVNDKASADLMVDFYKNLLDGKSKKESLKLAMKEIMKTHPEPYYWGAFVLID